MQNDADAIFRWTDEARGLRDMHVDRSVPPRGTSRYRRSTRLHDADQGCGMVKLVVSRCPFGVEVSLVYSD